MLRGFRNNKDVAKSKNFFLKNGAAVLEQIIVDFNGNCNPIRTYSAEELEKATDNWCRMLHWGSSYQMFKGVHDNREISVKRFESTPIEFMKRLKWIANEVAVASRMSEHKNILKLLGCCLETELPILVYEFPVEGNLSSYIDNENANEQLPFQTKLGIAIGLANSIAYLHHGLLKTFIHRDLHPRQVFLGQDYVAKLSNFHFSIPIPEGKTHVDADSICGTSGYMAEEVALQGRYTERSDVYSFGILLYELLSGRKRFSLISFDACDADSTFKEGSSKSVDELEAAREDYVTNHWERDLKAYILRGENRAQKMECTKLIASCLKKNADDRPNMIEVAKALILIKKHLI